MKKWIVRLLMSLGILAGSVQLAFAGTDLSISCPSIGVCTITPSGTPLFNESGWYPGATVTQRFTFTNSSSQAGFAAIQVNNYSDVNNLGQVVTIEIRRGSPVGPLIYGGVTMHQFRDDGYFTIDTLTSGQTTDYYLTATMPVTAGNQYQNSSLIFDLKAGLEITPIVPPSGAGSGTGTVLGSTTQAQPPVCNAQAPTGSPAVSITNIGTNTVSLSWTSVSPITHYALIFTRNSDGAQYGSTNIGSGTSYTINGISGGAGYTFEVFGVNDCAPGPRGRAVSGIIPGPVLTTRPTGPGGEVLGATTASPLPSPSISPTAGQVLGATSSCLNWKIYLPLIILLVQFLLLLILELLRKHEVSLRKWLIAAVITILSIVIFYWLRQCDCYAQSIWAWFCKWYWVVAILLTLVMRVFGYAFIEEVEEVKT